METAVDSARHAADEEGQVAPARGHAAHEWPRLSREEWESTYATLHRWLQIAGKTRLALAPMQNHWWQTTLYVSARGLTTSPIPYGDREFEVDFDFIDHLVAVRTSRGETRGIPLEPHSVADFYTRYTAMLTALDIEVDINAVPSELADATSFLDDEAHASYDADAAHRCWRILAQTDRVLKEFRGRFLGKSSPSHFWWGAFDIACTRFSGRRAPRHPGGIPNLPDDVTVEAYSHECISAGWWPGSIGGAVTEPAFYAYSYPMPPECAQAVVKPDAAYFHPEMREWILPYESVRLAADPHGMLLEFLQSTYEVAADLGKWDRLALERPG
ncbi:MAG: DUF5996 family protein [Gemmatimonadota bacterium]|nr:DUF5996 family protein [Gemmatimonadota bacterium]